LSEIPASVAGVADIHANVDEPAFSEAIEKIQTYIAAGDTYQVNYTIACTSMPMATRLLYTGVCANASLCLTVP
jgi:anthranilate/para-aminobenzoate synthase component I